MTTITLIPIAMVIPTRDSIYAPSRINQPREIEETEFLARYADHPYRVLVSFDPDGESNPQPITAYGGRYIVGETS